nr:putative U-box domain-containing protein 42 [Ipomoea batatas]
MGYSEGLRLGQVMGTLLPIKSARAHKQHESSELVYWLNGDQDSSGNVQSWLADISEFTKAAEFAEMERESFVEIGSYLYRASSVLMELQINKKTPAHVAEILQSLRRSFGLAEDIIKKAGRGSRETTSAVEELQGLVKEIGKGLTLMPSSAYGDQGYAAIAAKSLSIEIKTAQFLPGKTRNEPAVHQEVSRAETERTETDLYSIDVDVSMENLQVVDSTSIHFSDSSLSLNGRDQWMERERSRKHKLSMDLHFPQMAQSMEPMYETFFCPLTKKIMDDPVTTDTGITYERRAIVEWISKFGSREEIVCPKSGQKLKTRILRPNMALKATIDEWKDRNEAVRIKMAREALSSAKTQDIVLDAIEDLRTICRGKPYNQVQVCSTGMIPVLAKFLDYKNRTIRRVTLELLHELAEDNNDGKETITREIDVATIIRMLSSNHSPVKHASASLLLGLSKCQSFCDSIKEVPGAILMLITTKYKENDDFTSETADKVLKSLERSPHNIKHMAENGYWEPLINYLNEGNEETKMEMASYIGEIVLVPDRSTFVAERASPALIKMLHTGNSLSRNAAFKALNQISLHHTNGNILVEAGIIQVMVEEIFNRKIYDEPMDSKKEAAGILANILEFGLQLESLEVNVHGHRFDSEYTVHNIVHMIRNSSLDELNINLIRILQCLMKFQKTSAAIVSAVKETEAGYILIEFINYPNEELGVASIKFLIALSPLMGHTLSDRLCKTRGQPVSLVQPSTVGDCITEKQAVSAIFLAKLPHQNLTLNLALVEGKTVPTIINQINKLQNGGAGTRRHVNAYFEGLVGILARFTSTLYDHQILQLVKAYNFTLIFSELLMKPSSDEIQKLSATALGNLSKQSVSLSKAPTKKAKYLKASLLRRCFSLNPTKHINVPLCPVHRGTCSSEETFCLVDAKALERLLACLEHKNAEVVEASLSAISTLLDDKVDIDKSVSLLMEKQAIQHVLNVVKEHREEALWHKSFWMIEKILSKGGDQSTSDISQDRLFPATLITAFHHGDVLTRQMAEKILMHLKKMPQLTTTSFTM